MTEPVTTIILAPSGAGKSTRIEAWKETDKNLVHINRDAIGGEVRDAYGINASTVATGNVAPEKKRLLENQREAVFNDQLQTAFANNVAHVVIDFPPNGSHEWLKHTIDFSKAHGRKVVIEGIAVNPHNSLARYRAREAAYYGQPDYAIHPETPQFQEWLDTYVAMTGTFMRTASKVDEARLFDNNANGEKPRLIAEWQNGKLRVIDEKAFADFLKLEQITASEFYDSAPGAPSSPHAKKNAPIVQPV